MGVYLYIKYPHILYKKALYKVGNIIVMVGEIRFKTDSGLSNVKAAIVGVSGEVWTGSNMVESSGITTLAWQSGLITCPELFTSNPEGLGFYQANWPNTLTKDALYTCIFYNDALPSPSGSHIGIQDDPTEYHTAKIKNVYHAYIDTSIDDVNGQDEYTVVWFNDSERVTSNITNATIQVINRSDGTDLIAESSMTQIGSIGSYKYDESSNRMTAGEAVLIVVSATINGSSQSFAAIASRDSTT
jgi:hypothetical protein